MSRWIPITETIVRTDANTAILDAVQGLASSRGEGDPLPAFTTRAIGRILAAVQAANDLDTDATKIPGTLEWLAINLILRSLKGYLQMELTDAEKQQQRNDDSYLNDIVREPIRFELPDSPAGTGNRSPSITAETINAPARRTGLGRQAGI